MNKNPQTYHGEWWVPAVLNHDLKETCLNPKGMMGSEAHYEGTLTYHETSGMSLELYHYSSKFYAKHYGSNDVMWGQDANGHIFTLFNVTMKELRIDDFTCTIFDVGLILMGEHVLSIEDTRYKSCVVQFSYLRNWAFHNNITQGNAGTCVSFKTPYTATKLLEVINDDGAYWRLWQCPSINKTIHDLTIKQTTEFEIEATTELSISSFLKQIEEFAQFLSIALYGDQNPAEVKLTNKETKRESVLLFKKDISVDPGVVSLIDFNLLKDKLPQMLNKWHENYDKIAPISSYLINSLQNKSRFDVPDFLIIAQALDGYHKRFVNKKDEKDIRKYEEQIEILLNQFKEVKAIKECRINPKVLKDTRHKYSHLFPDEEKSLAVEGDDLYWLTEKCKILLTCCILDMIGLSNKEIDLCCEYQSPIRQIIDSLPPEFE
ncbi:MAG: hypothetical protein K6A93_06660 [Bacteroidaceae bacterium]|nr:hypothetical protein [Bacteroidaceae bacterium]